MIAPSIPIPDDWTLDYTERSEWFRGPDAHARAWRAFCAAPKGWASFTGPDVDGSYVVRWREYAP